MWFQTSIYGNALSILVVSAILYNVVYSTSYFIHLSDPHIDFNYKVGSSAECTWRGFGIPCCHDDCKNGSSCIRAPRFGHKYCDIPPETAQLIIEAMAKENPDPILVMLTGDLTSHDAFFETPDHIAEKWDWMFTQIKKNFGKNVKIVSAIGNHDVYLPDQVSDNVTDEAIIALTQVMYDHGLIHKDNPDENAFILRGYYKTAIPNTNVDVIVMNNIIDMYQNGLSDPNNTDPGNMYTWVNKAVAESAAQGRKVWIVGHIAPSYQMERVRGMKELHDLIKQYGRDVIPHMFFGHTHYDEFMATGMESLSDMADNIAFITPAMVGKGGINPSARVYYVNDGDNDLNIINYCQYRMDMEESNKQDKFIFKKKYTFLEHYGLPDLSPKSFQSISQHLLVDEKFAIDYMLDMYTWARNKTCDEYCRRSLYCLTLFRENETLFETCNSTSVQQLVDSFYNNH